MEAGGDIPAAVAGLACAARGADVIKLEPVTGDPLRHVSPYAESESKLFQTLNRGKSSVTISSPGELDRILKGADIVIVSTTRPHGLPPVDEDALMAADPGVIVISVSAFGPRGPMGGTPGNDLMVQAVSGALMAERKTRPDAVTPAPLKSTRFVDYGTGLMMCVGISAALLHRARTGKGQRVETSMLHNMLTLQGGRAVTNEMADVRQAESRARLHAARAAGESLREAVRPAPDIVNPFYRAFQTRNGAVFVGALSRRLRDRARTALGTDLMLRDSPDWNPRDPEQMAVARRKQVELEQRVKERTTQEWIDTLEAAGVPTGEVVFPEDLAETPHLHANRYLIEIEQPGVGRTLQVAPPIRYSRFPDPDLSPAPSQGEKNPRNT